MDGASSEVKGFGDVRLGHVLPVGEEHHRALLDTQSGHRPQQIRVLSRVERGVWLDRGEVSLPAAAALPIQVLCLGPHGPKQVSVEVFNLDPVGSAGNAKERRRCDVVGVRRADQHGGKAHCRWCTGTPRSVELPGSIVELACCTPPHHIHLDPKTPPEPSFARPSTRTSRTRLRSSGHRRVVITSPWLGGAATYAIQDRQQLASSGMGAGEDTDVLGRGIDAGPRPRGPTAVARRAGRTTGKPEPPGQRPDRVRSCHRRRRSGRAGEQTRFSRSRTRSEGSDRVGDGRRGVCRCERRGETGCRDRCGSRRLNGVCVIRLASIWRRNLASMVRFARPPGCN